MSVYLKVMRITASPALAICCGASPDREYLNERCWAEMQVELAGLPIALVTAISDESPWNESANKNIAAANVECERLLFTNCDIVIPREVAELALHLSTSPSCVNVYRRDEQADGSWIDNEQAIGDCQIVSRDTWQCAGGFDERLTGWGFIDYSFAIRCRNTGAEPFAHPTLRVRHHWHPRLSDDEYRAMNQRNQEIALS